MTPKTAKTCLVVTMVGLALTMGMIVGMIVAFKDRSFGTTALFIFTAFLLLSTIGAYRKISEYERKTLEWYRASYPGSVEDDGRARCFLCQSDSIREREVPGKYSMAEHSCRSCGTALFYTRDA